MKTDCPVIRGMIERKVSENVIAIVSEMMNDVNDLTFDEFDQKYTEEYVDSLYEQDEDLNIEACWELHVIPMVYGH